jgi:ethanolamine kinase
MSKAQLEQEIACLQEALTELGSPVVFCHNDLLLKNIIYNEDNQKVSFIDFEYVAYNYQAFDIANHFCEYAGMELVDFSLYPDRQYQLGWLRAFLEASFEHAGRPSSNVTDLDVERLYVQVNKFSLACHIFWSLWALIQARFSTIDYDYIDFARQRLAEYWRRKDEFLHLELP